MTGAGPVSRDSLSSLLSTGAGILKRLLGESKYRGGHSQVDYLVSLSTGAGILKRLLGESKYRGRHSQETTW